MSKQQGESLGDWWPIVVISFIGGSLLPLIIFFTGKPSYQDFSGRRDSQQAGNGSPRTGSSDSQSTPSLGDKDPSVFQHSSPKPDEQPSISQQSPPKPNNPTQYNKKPTDLSPSSISFSENLYDISDKDLDRLLSTINTAIDANKKIQQLNRKPFYSVAKVETAIQELQERKQQVLKEIESRKIPSRPDIFVRPNIFG